MLLYCVRTEAPFRDRSLQNLKTCRANVHDCCAAIPEVNVTRPIVGELKSGKITSDCLVGECATYELNQWFVKRS